MPAGWRRLLEREGEPSGPVNFRSQPLHRDPRGSKALAAYPDAGPPGSAFETLEQQVLDGSGAERVVLAYDDGMLATSFPNHYVAREVARAANRWTAEEWLSRDSRLAALLMVATVLPDAAAEEIRRAGQHPQMVGVALGMNALGKPFGHPLYHGIYQAAVELDLPVVLQVGADAAADLFTAPVTGGPISTYGEQRTLEAEALQVHVTSMIMQGVFEKFPSLKLLLVGGGGAWIPGYMWRLDYFYNVNAREVPWLKRRPSEYFVEHVRVTTYGLEAPRKPDRLAAALQAEPGLDAVFMYASCYPNADWQDAETAAAKLPPEWRSNVLHSNAAQFFRSEAAMTPGVDR